MQLHLKKKKKVEKTKWIPVRKFNAKAQSRIEWLAVVA